jgi:hypothetical protein
VFHHHLHSLLRHCSRPLTVDVIIRLCLRSLRLVSQRGLQQAQSARIRRGAGHLPFFVYILRSF